jgi:PAS domain S-box-containing protein
LGGLAADLALRQHLAAIVECSQDAIISETLDGVITSWNRGAEQLFGYSAEEMAGQSVNRLIPKDRQDEEPVLLSRLRAAERIEHYETVRQRKDGTLIDISLTVSPICDANGQVVGASKIARDITDRRRLIDQQNLVLGEMLHRVRNLSAVIDALARQSQPRDEPAVAAFVDAFLARVNALLSTGALLVSSSLREAELGQVLETVLRPFVDTSNASRISIEGPALALQERTAGALALAVHELATNAIKYGALSGEQGAIVIRWSIAPEADGGRVRLEWREMGGPPISTPPERRGFGSKVIGAAVSPERGGTTEVLYDPSGLVCRFEFIVGQNQ